LVDDPGRPNAAELGMGERGEDEVAQLRQPRAAVPLVDQRRRGEGEGGPRRIGRAEVAGEVEDRLLVEAIETARRRRQQLGRADEPRQLVLGLVAEVHPPGDAAYEVRGVVDVGR
jgi:hypothetical protein